MPHGTGAIIYTDKTMYEGDWKNGTSHGFGILNLPDGGRY